MLFASTICVKLFLFTLVLIGRGAPTVLLGRRRIALETHPRRTNCFDTYFRIDLNSTLISPGPELIPLRSTPSSTTSSFSQATPCTIGRVSMAIRQLPNWTAAWPASVLIYPQYKLLHRLWRLRIGSLMSAYRVLIFLSNSRIKRLCFCLCLTSQVGTFGLQTEGTSPLAQRNMRQRTLRQWFVVQLKNVGPIYTATCNES